MFGGCGSVYSALGASEFAEGLGLDRGHPVMRSGCAGLRPALGKECPLSSETPCPWTLIRSGGPQQLLALHTAVQSEALGPWQPGMGSHSSAWGSCPCLLHGCPMGEAF